LAALSRWPQYMAYFDPVTLLSAIAAVTEKIGLVATGDDELQRALQTIAQQIRLARPYQRRPRGMERRHLVEPVGSVQFRAARPSFRA